MEKTVVEYEFFFIIFFRTSFPLLVNGWIIFLSCKILYGKTAKEFNAVQGTQHRFWRFAVLKLGQRISIFHHDRRIRYRFNLPSFEIKLQSLFHV